MESHPEELKKSIIEMASVVEQALAVVSSKDLTNQEIDEFENKINQFHTEIDDQCFKYLALIRPVASDLRTTIAIMKMNNELERIGDEVVNIKRYINYTQTKDVPQLRHMINEVNKMVKNAMDSFVTKNIKLALNVIQNDQVVNDLNRSIIQTFFEGVKDQKFSATDGLHFVLVAKGLERIGDHATNISEDVVFLVSGNDIRHSTPNQVIEGSNTPKSKIIVDFLKRATNKNNNDES